MFDCNTKRGLKLENILKEIRKHKKKSQTFRINEYLLNYMRRDSADKGLTQTEYIENVILAVIANNNSKRKKDYTIKYEVLKQWVS